MWISDVYLKMQLDIDQRRRLSDARCAHMTSRVVQRRRLLERLARVQHDLDTAGVRDRVQRAPQTAVDCR